MGKLLKKLININKFRYGLMVNFMEYLYIDYYEIYNYYRIF